MSTNGKTLKFRAAKLKGFTVFEVQDYFTWGRLILGSGLICLG